MSALLSIQPKSDVYRPPYLDNSLDGTVPGVALAIQRSATTWPSIGVEVSATGTFEAVQSGRVVAGEGNPVASTHRDTLVSLLLGMRMAHGAIEPKLGASYVFSKLRQGDVEHGDLGRFAVTVGLDAVARVGQRVDIVPSIRYSIVPRAQAAQYAGLGNHIIRVGVGVRLSF